MSNPNEMLPQDLYKPVTKKLERRTVYARLKDNTWAAVLAKNRSFSFFNYAAKYLLCIIDVFTKYAWVKPLKDKKAKTVLHGFLEIVD